MEINKIINASVFSKKPSDNTTVPEDKDKKTSLFKSNKTTEVSLNTDDNEGIQALNEAENETQIQSVKDKKSSKIKQDINIEKNIPTELKDSFSYELNYVKDKYKENKNKYEEISEKVSNETGVKIPPELICAIHYRESANNFDCYFQNGDPLGAPTVNYPQGLYFDNFVDSATAALIEHCNYFKNSVSPQYNVADDFSTMSSCLEFAECYNGYGYRVNGHTSPYVYSGTTKYNGGLYTSDGVYDETAYDSRPGVAIVMQELMKNS